MPQYQGVPTPMDDPMKETIILAACEANEILPQTADLPADIFTACLTTPIKVCPDPCLCCILVCQTGHIEKIAGPFKELSINLAYCAARCRCLKATIAASVANVSGLSRGGKETSLASAADKA